MSMWRIHAVTIENLLGYQGNREFHFSEGLQVVEAPNHTGKTSLTLAILWALTGVVPQLPRINRQSFRLTNRHAGSATGQSCQVDLTGDDRRLLVVKRLYSGARPDPEKELTVEVDDTVLTGQQAQERLLQELKLKPDSLEGCGVVLQDHRLGFITGKDSDISDVINDMLGLTVLSQLVPTLEARLKEAKDLQKEISNFLEAADPLARWQQRDIELRAEFQNRENEAITAGFSRAHLEDPSATASQELAAAAQTLQATAPEPSKALAEVIQLLRTQLDGLRQTSPLGQELAKLQARKSQLDQWATTANTLKASYGALGEELSGEASRGEMDGGKLAAAIADLESVLQKNQKQREQLEDENGLLTKAYSHLLGHQESRECPVCEGDAPAPDLLKKLKARIEDRVADELAKLKQQDDSLGEQKAAVEKHLKLVRDLKDQHRRQFEQVTALQTQIKAEPFCWAEQLDADALFLQPSQRSALLANLAHAIVELAKVQARISEQMQQMQGEAAQQEATRFQPAEKQITRVSEKLLPVIAAAAAIEAHGQLRDKAAARKSQLEKLRDEAQDAAGHLQKITKALAQHEEQTASAAVRARLPRISEFFKAVTGNPDYDGLDIQTAVSRDKVTYKIQATSSTIGNLNDAVGHVLSEGDLSAASMALLIGLASGDSHHLGFLLLDDPAQGMDETLQSNLAQAVARLEKPKQVIILTHQRTFAEALKQVGARYCRMHSWHLGRVQDA